MKKLFIFISLLLVISNLQAQTRYEFKELMVKWNCTIETDTSTYIYCIMKDATREISGTKYLVDVHYIGLCQGNTLVSWSETWADATKEDIIRVFDSDVYLRLYKDVYMWSGKFGGKLFISVPQYNWQTDSWYINNLFLKDNTSL